MVPRANAERGGFGHLRAIAIGAMLTAGLAGLGGGLGGCSRPLLSPEDERSPFDRYDTLRNQYAQQVVEDEFGRQKPNLRARLAPKE